MAQHKLIMRVRIGTLPFPAALRRCQYLYFSTSKASKLSTILRQPRQEAIIGAFERSQPQDALTQPAHFVDRELRAPRQEHQARVVESYYLA